MAKDPVAVTSGRLGAYISHSRHDGRAITAAAREKAAARFLDQARAEADERGEKLTEEELERRARMLRKAFAVRMALKSVMARQAKKKRAAEVASRLEMRRCPEHGRHCEHWEVVWAWR